jgi:hypothetical protein
MDSHPIIQNRRQQGGCGCEYYIHVKTTTSTFTGVQMGKNALVQYSSSDRFTKA